MAKLKDRYCDIPNGWKFHVKETEFTVEGQSFNNLVDLVIYHMEINDLQTPLDLLEIIEEQLCQTAPAHMVNQG